MESYASDELLFNGALLVGILVVLLVVVLHRLVNKMFELEVMHGERDGWINIAAECRRDGGAKLRRNQRLNEGILETLAKADMAHSKGHLYTQDTGRKYIDE